MPSCQTTVAAGARPGARAWHCGRAARQAAVSKRRAARRGPTPHGRRPAEQPAEPRAMWAKRKTTHQTEKPWRRQRIDVSSPATMAQQGGGQLNAEQAASCISQSPGRVISARSVECPVSDGAEFRPRLSHADLSIVRNAVGAGIIAVEMSLTFREVLNAKGSWQVRFCRYAGSSSAIIVVTTTSRLCP